LASKNLTISAILSFIGSKNYVMKGKNNVKIKEFKPISIAKHGDISFCNTKGKKEIKLISTSKASVIICHSSLRKNLPITNSTFVFVDNPRLWFLRCIKKFGKKEKRSGIHHTAIIESKKIGNNVYVGPFSYIEKNVSIGANSAIHGNVYIYENTVIGKNVTIYSSAVIGADGYGYEKNESLKWEKFPQQGGVEIQDNVEIGVNSCIVKGTLENTIIGKGSKIGHLVNIAHNVIIGSGCMVLPQSVLAGGCILGDNVFVSLGVTIRDKIKVNNDAVIGMGSVVTKDVPKKVTVIGIPARPVKKIRKS